MSIRVWGGSLAALAVFLISQGQCRADLVIGPALYPSNPQSQLNSSNAADVALDGVYTFTATSAIMFMQFEVNENNDASVDVTLDFFKDNGTVNGLFDGGNDGVEDLGLDYAAPSNPDFSGTLTSSTPQDLHEWTLSGLTLGTTYGVKVIGYSNFNNGAELIAFSSQSVAVPEPSAFLCLGLVAALAGTWKFKRSS